MLPPFEVTRRPPLYLADLFRRCQEQGRRLITDNRTSRAYVVDGGGTDEYLWKPDGQVELIRTDRDIREDLRAIAAALDPRQERVDLNPTPRLTLEGD